MGKGRVKSLLGMGLDRAFPKFFAHAFRKSFRRRLSKAETPLCIGVNVRK